MRTGEHSVFYGATPPIDTFQERQPGDVITSLDWNKLGDSLYRLETKLIEMNESEDDYKLCPEVDFWQANYSPQWNVTKTNQISATGRIIMPISGCVLLGTDQPFHPDNLVKVNVRYDLPGDQRGGIGCNITTAFYCPWNSKTSTTARIAPTLTPEIQRTIIVGIYFDGYPVPADINTWGLICSVLVMGI